MPLAGINPPAYAPSSSSSSISDKSISPTSPTTRFSHHQPYKSDPHPMGLPLSSGSDGSSTFSSRESHDPSYLQSQPQYKSHKRSISIEERGNFRSGGGGGGGVGEGWKRRASDFAGGSKRGFRRRLGRVKKGDWPFILVFVGCLFVFFSALSGTGYVPLSEHALTDPPAAAAAFELGKPVFDPKDDKRGREIMEERRKMEEAWAKKKRPKDGAWMKKQREDGAVRRKPAPTGGEEEEVKVDGGEEVEEVEVERSEEI